VNIPPQTVPPAYMVTWADPGADVSTVRGRAISYVPRIRASSAAQRAADG
jgi:hypothetical protein